MCSKTKGQLLNLAVTVANAVETANYSSESHKKQATKLVNKMETTTMTCTSEKGDLLKLDRKKLTEFTAAHPETGKKLNSVLSADLIDYLKKIPFLENLPNSKLVSLCECVFVLCMYRTHICGYACVYVRVCVVYYVNIYIYIYIYIHIHIHVYVYNKYI